MDSITPLRERVSSAETKLATAQERITHLSGDPAITTRPEATGWLASQHTTWSGERD